MMNKPTKKQHYVPQVYLRGFSSDEVFVIRNELESQCIVSSKSVPIQSICREDFLYEIKDSEGSYIALNFIEKYFSALEAKFSIYREQLLNKAFIKDNQRTKCFFTTEEKCFWKLYVVLQMLRLPKVLEVAREFSAEYFEDLLSTNEAYGVATQLCLVRAHRF